MSRHALAFRQCQLPHESIHLAVGLRQRDLEEMFRLGAKLARDVTSDEVGYVGDMHEVDFRVVGFGESQRLA